MPGTSPYIIASRILTPSYIALTSAFRFHNITTQLPIKIIVFSTKYHKMLKGIKFIKVSKRLMFGYDEYNNAYVSDVEKTFIDDIWYHKGKLHADEELEIAIMKKTLNLEKLKSYAQVLMDKKVVRELRIKLKKFNINF